MPCYAPRLAYMHKYVKQPLRFTRREACRTPDGIDPYNTPEYKALTNKHDWKPVPIPCQQCIYCRLQNSKEKAIRAIHESKISPTGNNCFLTLTYNDDCVPKNDKGQLIYKYEHIKSFMDSYRDWETKWWIYN